MNNWQQENKKHLLSVNVQKDGDNFCCIALTNPPEVVLVDPNGEYYVLTYQYNGRPVLPVHVVNLQ
jgi:hypothetical protein